MTVAGLAQLYGQAGVKLGGATLAQQLAAGVRSTAAKPASQASLLGLIVRDLGLHDRPAVDLAKAATATTRLDPLQVFLIAADSAAHAKRARALAVAGRTEAPCPGSTQPGTAPAPLAGSGNGIMRTILLVQAQEITVVNTPSRETHYGPAGHAALAGKELRLGVKVVIKEKLPDAIRCGLLSGDRDLPPPGPAKNRPIFWNALELLKYGTIAFDPESMATGGDGISTLVFKPKSEDFPGFGTEYKATGDVTATVGETLDGSGRAADRLTELDGRLPQAARVQVPASELQLPEHGRQGHGDHHHRRPGARLRRRPVQQGLGHHRDREPRQRDGDLSADAVPGHLRDLGRGQLPHSRLDALRPAGDRRQPAEAAAPDHARCPSAGNVQPDDPDAGGLRVRGQELPGQLGRRLKL